MIAKTLADFVLNMKNRTVIRTVDGYEGLVNGITVEDGSGLCWIINMCLMRGAGKTFQVDVFWREGTGFEVAAAVANKMFENYDKRQGA